ncbi:META domain-containing protein [Bradymonas sediminis]|uniref:Uncharacterized protein n=1 Tax=Bradymonas sediminis TaxID=1548548 RepID=A0A2Z4FN47_9DELT|nr:META domain-containing protein [Bradymonas sediminis]AWV90098.1 hypothetical protein DN745_12450 [Bradymonas sediminis]TDP75931.1 heat shock protein HslJ [Bradymonas sediminis]
MKLFLKSVLLLVLAMSFGCSSNPERVEDEAVSETTSGEVNEESTPDGELEGEAGVEEAPAEEGSPDLVGAEWSVESLAGSGLVEETQPTLMFTADGEVSGQASCNRFFGSYQLVDDGLTITTAGTTRMACPVLVMEQEQLMLKVLNEVDGFEIDAEGVLRLHTGAREVISAGQ